MKKKLKYGLIIAGILTLLYFFPIPVLFFILCGVYDVARNKGLDFSVVKQYFFGNGVLTWLVSPINVLMDVISLPYINKGVYQLEDLPPSHQDEIKDLLASSERENLVGKLEKKVEGLPRAMFFFKWYGKNVESVIDIPSFKKDYRYIKTIGVSVFNRKESTSRHFGPFRATLRVLYSISDVTDENVYIKVGKIENRWKDNKLFIFDDTLLHQSFNDSDEPRYCLFVDIVRPTFLNFVLNFAVVLIRFIFKGVNSVFYKNWKLINN